MPPAYVAHPEYDYARDFKGYGEEGLNPKWPNGAKIAVSFVINYEEVCHATLCRVYLRAIPTHLGRDHVPRPSTVLIDCTGWRALRHGRRWHC